MRRRTGNGTKSDRHYDWALIDVLADDAPVDRDEAGHVFLVVRRHHYTRELSFYRCHSTTPVSLTVLVNIICTRWKIEEDFQGAKSLAGLDQGQVTCWTSWIRWSLYQPFRRRRPRRHPRCHPHRRRNRTRPSTRTGQRPRTPGRPADHRTPHAPPRP